MELRTVGGRLQLGGTFKLVAIGYLIGMGVIFVPFFLLIVLVAALAGATGSADASLGFVLLLQVVMLPIILVMQAAMIGGAVILGLWLYQLRRSIRVVEEGPVPSPTVGGA
jgi:hypothetical protein